MFCTTNIICLSEATSTMKIKEVLNKFKLNANIYLRASRFTTEYKLSNLYFTECTHWVLHIIENFFDTYVCTPPKLNQILTLKHLENVYFFRLIMQKGFKSAVLHFYYIEWHLEGF